MTRTALIIGASRGLGLGLTRELSGRGWHVTATARDPDSPDLAALARERPDLVTMEAVDIVADDQVTAVAARLGDRTFDLLLVNAGVYGPAHQSVEAATPEEMGHLVVTNAVAPVRLARRLLGHVRDGGTIAFMSSRMGSVADNTSGGMDLYRASKAALNTLTRSLVAEGLGGRGLTVLSLHPGWVQTDMGGQNAPLDVATSVRGLAEVIERRAGTGGHAFVDYQGTELPW